MYGLVLKSLRDGGVPKLCGDNPNCCNRASPRLNPAAASAKTRRPRNPPAESPHPVAYQYAFVMKGLSKAYPGAKPVFKDITLSFLPGAKIAIIGPNGAGKSTLMKVIAGIDKDYQGEAWAAEGIRVGYLSQEPQLDASKDVRGNVMDGVRPIADMVDRFNAISAEMGDPKDDTDFDKLLEEMGTLQEKIDAVDGWTLDNQLEIAMEALRTPSPEAVSRSCRAARSAASRCASCCSRSPTSCCSTSRPTTSMRRASRGWRSICRTMPAWSSSSPTTATSSTTW